MVYRKRHTVLSVMLHTQTNLKSTSVSVVVGVNYCCTLYWRLKDRQREVLQYPHLRSAGGR